MNELDVGELAIQWRRKFEDMTALQVELVDALRFALSVLVEGKAVPRDVVEHAIIDARAGLKKAGVL